MWEPQPLGTLRASTACTGIDLVLDSQLMQESDPRFVGVTIKVPSLERTLLLIVLIFVQK
jgi:hypothetical protein